MDKCKSATCITTPAVTEQTKRIFPLVGQLARIHSWHSCSSLLHLPAINRTLHHSGSGSSLYLHTLYAHCFILSEQYLFSRRSLVKRENPHLPLLTRLTVLLFCRIQAIITSKERG
ncbi:hypothetical protein HanIR_Chr10g0493451 [Helianthus annuus]|nr:hypothetical protein HanIR_Chr10g0493451 [Helianthus annuus]